MSIALDIVYTVIWEDNRMNTQITNVYNCSSPSEAINTVKNTFSECVNILYAYIR